MSWNKTGITNYTVQNSQCRRIVPFRMWRPVVRSVAIDVWRYRSASIFNADQPQVPH